MAAAAIERVAGEGAVEEVDGAVEGGAAGGDVFALERLDAGDAETDGRVVVVATIGTAAGVTVAPGAGLVVSDAGEPTAEVRSGWVAPALWPLLGVAEAVFREAAMATGGVAAPGEAITGATLSMMAVAGAGRSAGDLIWSIARFDAGAVEGAGSDSVFSTLSMGADCAPGRAAAWFTPACTVAS